MAPFVQYTAARLALFLACWGVLWLVGAKGVLGVLIALIVSGLISYVVLDKLRDRFGSAVAGRVMSLRLRFAAGRAAEDADEEGLNRSRDAESS